jgi:beta-galactosidase
VGSLQAVGSGSPRTTESYTGTSFTTYHGRMIAIVRSGIEQGEIKVTISAESLAEKVVTIKVV